MSGTQEEGTHNSQPINWTNGTKISDPHLVSLGNSKYNLYNKE